MDLAPVWRWREVDATKVFRIPIIEYQETKLSKVYRFRGSFDSALPENADIWYDMAFEAIILLTGIEDLQHTGLTEWDESFNVGTPLSPKRAWSCLSFVGTERKVLSYNRGLIL